MSCYWLNRKEILQKAKERYSREKQRSDKRKVKRALKKLITRRKRQDQ